MFTLYTAHVYTSVSTHLYDISEHGIKRRAKEDGLLRQDGADHLKDIVNIKTEKWIVETNVEVAVCGERGGRRREEGEREGGGTGGGREEGKGRGRGRKGGRRREGEEREKGDGEGRRRKEGGGGGGGEEDREKGRKK